MTYAKLKDKEAVEKLLSSILTAENHTKWLALSFLIKFCSENSETLPTTTLIQVIEAFLEYHEGGSASRADKLDVDIDHEELVQEIVDDLGDYELNQTQYENDATKDEIMELALSALNDYSISDNSNTENDPPSKVGGDVSEKVRADEQPDKTSGTDCDSQGTPDKFSGYFPTQLSAHQVNDADVKVLILQVTFN